MSKADPVVQRWQEDVSRISYEVIEMHHNRNVYRTVTQIAVDHGGLPPSAFFPYLNATYGVTQVAAVRRQADVRKDTVSLARLLDQIRGKPQRLTRDGFVERFGPDDIRAGFATWSRLFARRVRDYVDPALVKADLDELRAVAKQAKDWADSASPTPGASKWRSLRRSVSSTAPSTRSAASANATTCSCSGARITTLHRPESGRTSTRSFAKHGFAVTSSADPFHGAANVCRSSRAEGGRTPLAGRRTPAGTDLAEKVICVPLTMRAC